ISVLNTATNSIYIYDNETMDSSIPLDRFHVVGMKVGADNGQTYVLGNDFSVFKVTNDGQLQVMYNISDALDTEAIFNFKVIDNHVYVSVSGTDGSKTYRFSTDDTAESANAVEVIQGNIVDEETYYQSTLVPEGDYHCGHTCIVTILNKDGTERDRITLRSDNFIVGAQYLGTNTDGNYIIKQYDMDLTDQVEETIRTIDKNHNVVGCVKESEQIMNNLNQVKVIDGNVYELTAAGTEVSIDEIATEHLPEEARFETGLDKNAVAEQQTSATDTAAMTSTDGTAAAAATISRSTIISNAKAYHRQFTWTCSSSNLASLTNWTCPRYVSGAGSYTYMPYCWGGFSTTGEYTSGMSRGGRVGNINTSTAGHVGNTYGLDCSGYVSRCWGLGSKKSTSTLPNVATKITYASLQQGDMIDKAGSHVVLYEKADGNGGYILYEATKWLSMDRVAYTVRSISSLQNSSYVAYRYNNVS
ncbi:MAG: hypothetical protein Q4D42_04775, partial [Eubacteriales bacterium]|nr:hypothetical protein [Eubacteriales bacterium]